jgi:chorismate-pyruvate lyase
MTALSILQKLNDAGAQDLAPIQRILLITDGTLTEILEAHYFEPIRLVKLSQQTVTAAAAPALLEPQLGENFMERKIILRGANSGKNYVYAESIIAFERLDKKLSDDLLHSDTPLGRLWLEHRLETFKEMLDIRKEPANDHAVHFRCSRDALLLMRNYRVSAGGNPAMIITEYFPASPA